MIKNLTDILVIMLYMYIYPKRNDTAMKIALFTPSKWFDMVLAENWFHIKIIEPFIIYSFSGSLASLK